MAQSFGEYLTDVKLARKRLDGKDTYGKWTKYIRSMYDNGASVEQTASFLTVAKERNNAKA